MVHVKIAELTQAAADDQCRYRSSAPAVLTIKPQIGRRRNRILKLIGIVGRKWIFSRDDCSVDLELLLRGHQVLPLHRPDRFCVVGVWMVDLAARLIPVQVSDEGLFTFLAAVYQSAHIKAEELIN